MKFSRIRYLAFLLAVIPALAYAGGQKDATKTASTGGAVTLSIFYPIDPKAATTLKSYNDMLYFQEMEKRTGIKLEFKHPPAGQEIEQFNLLMASNTFPDMVYWEWNSVAGGPGRAVSEGQIVKLNDLIDKYAPNIKKTMTDNPEWRKQAVLDDGSFYMVPKIKKDAYLLVSNGFQIRADWLDKLHLKAPTTIDEWYRVLTAIKKGDPNGNGKNDEIPFSAYGTSTKSPYTSIRKIAYAYGVVADFYMDGNTVKYGPIQPAYKAYLTEMWKWYAEGLLDPDYVSQDQKGFEAKVVGDKVAAYSGLVNGHMGKFHALKKNDPSFKLIGLPFPVGPAGKSYGLRNPNVTGQGIAISTNCKNKEAGIKWCDYLFTQDGIMLSNFGVEGVTYKMVNGKPEYTDLIMNNPDKLPAINAMSKYLTVASNGVLVQLEESFRALHDKAQQAATEIFISSTDSSLDMPSAQPAPKEAEVLGNIMNDVRTYTDEMLDKFVMGTVPIEEFDKYTATIKKMGIDDATAIWQTVVDRYKKR